LILDLVVGKVVKRAQDQRLEHQHRVYRLAPGTGLSVSIRLAPNPLETRAERLPWHDDVDLDQRVFLRVQARITV